MPQLRCRVCGIASASMDTDGRAGTYSGTLTFGPNQVDGMINETMIKEYKVYFVDAHRRKLKLVAKVPRSASPSNTACCETDYYQLPMTEVPLESSEGDPPGPSRIMIVPVDIAGAEMPLGEVMVIPDATTTTTSMLELEETTFRDEGKAGSSDSIGLRISHSAVPLLGALVLKLAAMQP